MPLHVLVPQFSATFKEINRICPCYPLEMRSYRVYKSLGDVAMLKMQPNDPASGCLVPVMPGVVHGLTQQLSSAAPDIQVSSLVIFLSELIPLPCAGDGARGRLPQGRPRGGAPRQLPAELRRQQLCAAAHQRPQRCCFCPLLLLNAVHSCIPLGALCQ